VRIGVKLIFKAIRKLYWVWLLIAPKPSLSEEYFLLNFLSEASDLTQKLQKIKASGHGTVLSVVPLFLLVVASMNE
jgi:hypothetical protein